MSKSKIDTNKNKSLPDGWKQLPFGDVFEFIQSLALSRDQLTTDEAEGTIYNIHYGDIHSTYKSDMLDFDKEKKIPKIKGELSVKPENILKDGDLAIADASEDYEGVAASMEIKNLRGKKAIGGLHTFIARDYKGLTMPGFRTYVLKNREVSLKLKKLATGSKVFGVSKTNLTTLNILLPSNKEQTKISKILNTWDKGIETIEELIKKKELIKKALVQNLFTGKKRFKEYKKEKWNSFQLQEIATIFRGSSPRPKGDPRYYGGSIPRLMVQDVTRDGKYVTPKIDFLTEEGAKLSRPVPKGTLVLVCSGDIGIPSILDIDACIHDGFIAFKNINENVNVEYLFYLFTRMHDEFNKSATHGGIFVNMTTTGIKEQEVILPSLLEQNKIVAVVSALDKEINSLKAQLKHIHHQKKGLMQQLLTGKKRVKV